MASRVVHGIELVLLPGGEFTMGGPDDYPDRRDDEAPSHRVYLDSYWISRFPITYAQYQEFIQASGHSPSTTFALGEPDHPAAVQWWGDGEAYCDWLSAEEGEAFRLPTEAEWEKACRGPESFVYPWGDRWDPQRCNSGESLIRHTTPADQYLCVGSSPFGVADMAGNVWE